MAASAEAAGNTPDAIAWYRRALEINPADVAAIAGHGRLTFRKPDVPFLDEVRRRHQVDVCEVTIEIRNPCNYRCFYCVAAGHNNEPVKEFDLSAIEQTLGDIQAKLVVTQFDCGGGEPTIHPQFPELLRLCAARGAVSFPSNISQDPSRWLPHDLAARIYIRAAVHPETESKTGLEKYAQHARHLIDAGCTFTSMFIAHPTRLSRMEEVRSFFAARDVPFLPIGFIGEYEGKSYPHAYTVEEKQLIGFDSGELSWFIRIQPHVNRIRNFRGIPCRAGYQNLYISRDGHVRRCTYDARRLDAPLMKPEPCAVKSCGCGMMLADLNQHEMPDFYNFFAPLAGLPPVNVEWMTKAAADLGYGSIADAMATEQMRMYDELMRAYGKDEFPEPAARA